MITSHNSEHELFFYNDRVKEIIDAGIMAEPFTYVPLLAGHMELVGGNAVVFGKITEGFDVIEPNIVPTITYEDVGDIVPTVYLLVTPVQTDISWGVSYPCLSYEAITAVLAITLPNRIYEGSTYFVNVIRADTGIDLSASYVADHGDTLADVKAGLIAAMTFAGMEVVAGSPDNQIYIYEISQTFCLDPYEAHDLTTIFKDFTVTAYVSSYGFTTKHTQLKCGATHGYGIVYKGRSARQCSVMKTNALNINIPFYTETGGPSLQERASVTFKVYHKPPDWAETYEIVYFGNLSMDYSLQMRVDEIRDLSSYGLVNHYGANIQATLDWTRSKNSRWKVDDYIWQEGDRIRFFGSINPATGYGEAIGGGFVYDYEIEQTGTSYGEAIGGDYLYFQAVDKPTPFVGQTNLLAEVYRPRKGLGITTPYGTGMVFEIGIDANGNKYHKGDVDQVIGLNGLVTVPAEVINKAHDCYKYIRLNYDHNSNIIHPFWAESIFPSDWWGGQIISNKLTSNGFPFLDDLSQRQTILDERLRHGGFLITGTRTNNIAHFTYLDYMDLPKKNGDITGLREVGFTLKVIQMYKETSIYINRLQTFNPDGTEQFVLTDKFLAEQRPMESDYGCQHPDSIMVNGRNLYYWDNSQGVFIRSAPNGQTVLDIKMKRWFKDLVKWIQTSGGKEVLETRIGANNDHDEIWVTFRMGTTVKGLIFNEKKGRYISEIDQITENYIHLGNFFAHLYHQTLWIMNVDEGQDFLSWSGTPTYAEIEVVSNIESVKNKIFNAIAVFADHLLQSLAKYVSIPAEASAVNEVMESNIPVFERKEGVYFGKIMKDENSKGIFISLFDRKLNGREMRGRYCFVKLKTTEHTEKVRIDSIVIFSTPSERNV